MAAASLSPQLLSLIWPVLLPTLTAGPPFRDYMQSPFEWLAFFAIHPLKEVVSYLVGLLLLGHTTDFKRII